VAWYTRHWTVLLARPWHEHKLFTINLRPLRPEASWMSLDMGAKMSMLNGTREQDDKRRPYLCGPGGLHTP